jgi:hypothetical protein
MPKPKGTTEAKAEAKVEEPPKSPEEYYDSPEEYYYEEEEDVDEPPAPCSAAHCVAFGDGLSSAADELLFFASSVACYFISPYMCI